ncbi:MAG: hypothetical protein RL373_1401 [Pseudomonadota bacterium]|jgi:hypothetical protein|nr:hypothetical protein [Polynucleobacter sp.]NBY64390.1 hypothetical protein [Betaproteobacteria bacterium]
MNRNSSSTSSVSTKLNLWNLVFILWVILILTLVIWTGSLSFKNGLKTEIVKANGLAWIDWLSQASQERFEPSYKIPACAGQPNQLDPVEKSPSKKELQQSDKKNQTTWAECFQSLTSSDMPLGQLRNPYTNQPVQFIKKCDSADPSLAGALVILKILPAPNTISNQNIFKPLLDSDPIDLKQQLRIFICDHASYPILIGDFEF